MISSLACCCGVREIKHFGTCCFRKIINIGVVTNNKSVGSCGVFYPFYISDEFIKGEAKF